MTEYEIADLAASKAFQLQGGVSLFQTAISMMTDIVLQYMNILFAYILAAYFIGANLGRRQVGVLTTLYVLFQTWLIVIIMARAHIMLEIGEALQEHLGPSEVTMVLPMAITTTSVAILVAVLFASLYFMWSIRHPKIE
jgi:hypothetical protein